MITVLAAIGFFAIVTIFVVGLVTILDFLIN